MEAGQLEKSCTKHFLVALSEHSVYGKRGVCIHLFTGELQKGQVNVCKSSL